jgi:hypothetical protein
VVSAATAIGNARVNMAGAYRGDTFRAMVVPRICAPRTAVAAAALACAATTAWGSPRTDPTVGRAVFTGATVPHPTSIELDPAAIGLGSVDELYVAVTGVIDQLHAALDAPSGGATPGARIGDTELGPGAMFAVLAHVGDSLTVGVEANISPTEPFPSDQRAFEDHVLGGRERDWQVSAGVSYKVADMLFAGASLSHQNTFLKLRYARDLALAACTAPPCAPGGPDSAELWNVDVRSPALSTSNLRVNVGVMVQILHDVWLGVAYHTPPGLETELTGHVTIERAPGAIAADPGPDPVTHIIEQSVVELQMPASIDAELRARLPRGLDLHVAGRWEDLSRFTGYDVRAFGRNAVRDQVPEWTERPRGFHDSFAGWAGVEQVDRGQAWLFGGRAGFETASLAASRTSPLTVAPGSLTLDLGAQLRLSTNLVAQLSYGLAYFPTVTVSAAGSAFDPNAEVNCAAAFFDYSTRACQAARDGYAIASAAGTYDRLEHALRLGLRYALP